MMTPPVCTGSHKPYQLRVSGGKPRMMMTRHVGIAMPYGYTRWRYVHFIRGRNAAGRARTCGHIVWRLEKS